MTETSQENAGNTEKNILFRFAGVKYPDPMQGDSLKQKIQKMDYRNSLFYSCAGLSVLWCAFVLSYGIGVFSVYPTLSSIPVFLPLSLLIMCVFPVALLVGGYIIYEHILKAQQTGTAILDAARILSSPAFVAAQDVETLASSVAGSLGKLRHALREIEDHVGNTHKKLGSDVAVLADAAQHLEKTMENVSQKIFKDRDTIIDLLKTIKAETSPTQDTRNEALQDAIKKQVDEKIQSLINQEKEINQSNSEPEELHSNELEEYNIRKPASFSLSEIQPLGEEPESFILRNERQLYEGLYALTVDLNRLLGTNAPQDLWPRYMRGDRNVFAEYFCEWIERNYHIYRETAMNEDFRKLSNRFISQFEMLRERLFDTPHAEVSEYLERSGVGRIYNLLSAEYV